MRRARGGLLVRPWTGVEPVDLDPDLAGDVELWNPYLLVAPPLVFLVLARLEAAGEVEAGRRGWVGTTAGSGLEEASQ